jgi:hypothetical protein
VKCRGGGAWQVLRHLPPRPPRARPGGTPSEIPSQTRSVSAFFGTCPTLTVLPRRTICNHLHRSRPEKILNVFQRIHLRFFRARGLASGRTFFASSRTAMSDRLLPGPASANPYASGDLRSRQPHDLDIRKLRMSKFSCSWDCPMTLHHRVQIISFDGPSGWNPSRELADRPCDGPKVISSVSWSRSPHPKVPERTVY